MPLSPSRLRCLSAKSLKLLACLFMLIDHAGLMLFPSFKIFRIIGRLAFPIFAFFIAEGCKYTRNRLKRLLLLLVPGVVFELVYVIYSGELEGNVFLTFSLSVLLIYCLQYAKKQFHTGKALSRILSVLLLSVSLVAGAVIATLVGVDYGFVGVLVPVIIAFTHYREGETAESFKAIDTHAVHLLALLVGTILLTLDAQIGSIQIWCLLSVPLVALYSGRPGSRGLKYFFYVFYPLHLLILEGIASLVKTL